jgi:hypothetical protein
LGQDAIQSVFVGAGRIFGAQQEIEEVRVFIPAGERIWIKISDVIRHPIGNAIFLRVMGFLDPSIGEIMKAVADPRLGAGQGKPA